MKKRVKSNVKAGSDLQPKGKFVAAKLGGGVKAKKK